MKKMKTLLSLVLVLIICFSVVPMTDLGIEVSAISESTFNSKLNELRNQYPNYSRWTGTYAGGSECWGFARLVADYVFGGNSSSWSKVNSISGVKAGDILQYGNTSGSGHTVFVTGVSGNTIYFVDCNGNGNYSGGTKVRTCGIKWDNTITKGSAMFGAYSFAYLLSSPSFDGSSTPADTTKPTISSTYIGKPSDTKNYFRVCCVASDNVGIDIVRVATWTKSNQSDLIWRDCVHNGSGTWFMDIKYSDYDYASNDGWIWNHFYAYDAAGNSAWKTCDVKVDTEAPVVSNTRVTSVTENGYEVTCTVTDNIGVTSVAFPSWTTNNGQDDVVWHEGTINGNTAKCWISKSDHNNENGEYATHVYAYDAKGNKSNIGATSAIVTNVKHRVDVNTVINNTLYESGYAGYTFDLYLNGSLVANNVMDFCDDVRYGTKWEIKDIKCPTAYKFTGGTTSGTVTSACDIRLNFGCTHSSTEIRNAKSASCTATGYTGDTYCKTCGTKLKTGTTIAKKSHSYTATITSQPTCTKEGVKTYKCSCGASYTESIAKATHNSNTTIPAVAATCTKTGLTEGKKCSVCGTVTVAQQTVAKKSHIDNNGDYKCDYGCGYAFEKPAPDTPTTPDEPENKPCSCNCHKGGISGFFFKLINFFQKLFGKNKVCACGVKH